MNRIAIAATSIVSLFFCFMTEVFAAGDTGFRLGPRDPSLATGIASVSGELERDTTMSPPVLPVVAKRDEGLDWLLVGENALKVMGWLGARWVARSGFNDGCLRSSDPRTISNLALSPSYVAKTCLDNPFRSGYAPTDGVRTNLFLGFSGQNVVSRAFDGTQKTALEWATIGCDLALAARHRSVVLQFRF
jgi:hypothetical protein